MPKYYRFRAFTPTRKMKRSRDPSREKEKEITKTRAELDRDLQEALNLACSHVPSWYLRRTSWRQSQWSISRQISDAYRASMQHSSYRRHMLYVRELVSELLKA